MSDWGPAAVELRDVSKVYMVGSQEVRALDRVSLRIERGEFISVMGPSGSGKTSLLSVMGCLIRPSSGRILIGGEDVTDLYEDRLAVFRAKKIGFVFQFFNLISTLTALENVMLPMVFAGDIPSWEMKARAMELLEAVGLSDRANHRPLELSGGQQQRVAIARALANDPEIVLADEPTGNLDSHTGSEIMDLIEQLNRELGKTFVIVTHDPAVARRTKKILYMRDGRLYDRPPEEVERRRGASRDERVEVLRRLLGEVRRLRSEAQAVSPGMSLGELEDLAVGLRMGIARIRRELSRV